MSLSVICRFSPLSMSPSLVTQRDIQEFSLLKGCPLNDKGKEWLRSAQFTKEICPSFPKIIFTVQVQYSTFPPEPNSGALTP